jgi:hypothetical protein
MSLNALKDLFYNPDYTHGISDDSILDFLIKLEDLENAMFSKPHDEGSGEHFYISQENNIITINWGWSTYEESHSQELIIDLDSRTYLHSTDSCSVYGNSEYEKRDFFLSLQQIYDTYFLES